MNAITKTRDLAAHSPRPLPRASGSAASTPALPTFNEVAAALKAGERAENSRQVVHGHHSHCDGR